MEHNKDAYLGLPSLHVEVISSGMQDDKQAYRVMIEEVDITKPRDKQLRRLDAAEITQLIDDGIKFRALRLAKQIKKMMSE